MTGSNNKKPNIILVLSDDHGAWAMGCTGNSEIRTPNLDRLAATGMRFENFFCTSPVCSPARASLITGRIPSQHGVLDWLRDGNVGDDATEYLAGQTAYTDILAKNGYICGVSGKWHMGDSLKPQKSFSHWYVHQKGGGNYYNAPMIRAGQLINEPGYITERITDDAIEYMQKHAGEDQPFYLSVHYTAPHSPWIDNHPKDIVDSYDDCPFETCPEEPLHPWRTRLTNEVMEDVHENSKGYFAAVTAMDMNIGRILDKLEKLGLKENTLVCYMSDNGFNCGHHGVWGKGNATFPQNMYDTSVKVPAIFSHPGHIPQGVVSDALVSGYDFMPTLLEYVDLENPEKDRLPGSSFSKILLGIKEEARENVVLYDEYGPVRMIRTKEWKYVHRYPYGPHELYDMVNDPEERTNLINELEMENQIISMKANLESWFVKYVDPAFDGTHEPVTGTGQLAMAGPAGKGKRAFMGDSTVAFTRDDG